MAGMEYDAAYTALEKHFRTQWAASTFSAVGVAYPNDSFVPPEIGDGVAWVRFGIEGFSADRASLGDVDPLFRFNDFIVIELNVSPMTGFGLLTRMADVAGAFFIGSAAPTTNGFRFLAAPGLGPIRLVEGWGKGNVRIPVQRDQIIN